MSPSLATLVLSASLALANVTPALAQAVTEDRYGPPPAGLYGGASGSGASTGQMLNWAGKRGGTTTGQLAAYARPEPLALARQFIPQLAHQSGPPQGPMSAVRTGPVVPVTASAQLPQRPPAPAQVPAQFQATPWPAQPPVPAAPPAPEFMGGAPPAPLPTSIYGTTPPPPQAPVQQMTQAFQMAASAPQPQAPASAPTPGARSGGAHLYSLHRAYGMTPDAIPPPPIGDYYILVGPPSSASGTGDKEDPDQGLDRQF